MPNAHLKIFFLVDSLHSIAAGSERQIYKLATRLHELNHSVELILLRHTQFSKSTLVLPIKMRCLEISSVAKMSSLTKLFKLKTELKSAGPSILHAFFPDSCLIAPTLLKNSKTKIITSRRDMGLIYQGKPSWLFQISSMFVDKIIANSIMVANLTSRKEKTNPNKICTIHNGIEEFDFSSNAKNLIHFRYSDSIKIALVANIKPVKRILDAVKALNVVIQSGQHVELAIIGEVQDKNYYEEIKNEIAKHGLNNRVHMTGSIPEPRRILRSFDIGILVSESEGLSNTIMEYMQSELPVVASNVGGNSELVDQEITGVLYEKGDIHQLANSLLMFIREPEKRKTMGLNAITKIKEQFTLESMISKHQEIYTNLLLNSRTKTS